jgi:16S rRNA processing protein RimM
VTTDPAQRVAVAYVSRTYGVRGEVRAETLTHCLERFDALSDIVLQRDGRPDLPLKLERWRVDGKGLLLKFAGFEAPETARAELCKGYVTVAPDQVAALPEGTYYIDDIVDSIVVDQDGHELGRIAEVMQMPSTDVYVVRSAKGEILVPAISDFVVEIGPGRVVVQGIEELITQ